MTFHLGGGIGFSCTHAYPHTSSTIGNNLKKRLKGLDMLVYQALKNLAKSVRVVAMLDDKEYQEKMRMYADEHDSQDDAQTGKVGGGKALLGKTPHSPFLWEDYEDNSMGGPVAYGHYKRRKVTWLNCPSSPRPSAEFAVALLTVSFIPCPRWILRV